MTMKAYTVLGISPGASAAEIKAAYRDRARMIHPDRFATDPRQAQAAHEAFVELSAAFRSALAASSATVTAPAGGAAAPRPAAPRVPKQRAPRTPQAPRAPKAPSQRPTVAPARQDEPVLTLLTVPQRCGKPWSEHALETWALTVVPEARRHLRDARRIARASGVSSQRHLTTATAHVLLTLTIDNMNGPRVMGVLGRLDAAYAALEIVLPRDVVDRLPARVTAPRPVDARAYPGSDEPSRGLLALFATAGALAAALAWTNGLGFFPG
jgi:hypothetical protein